MNNALIPGKEKAWFFHLYQKLFIANIVLIYHQAQMAMLRKEVRNRGFKKSTKLNQVKKRDFNNNASVPASGCVTIIRTPEIAFDIDKFGLMLKVVIQHDPELLFLNNQDKAR